MAPDAEVAGARAWRRARLGLVCLPSWLVGLAAYAALAVTLTWPLAPHLADRFPGRRPDDAYLHSWHLWWFREALSRGQNPYHTPLWHPPQGADLYLGTLAPLNGALGLLPQLLAGPLVAYNLIFLLNITLAGLGGFLLARRVTGHVGGAAVAGLAVAGSPWLLGQLDIGHLNVGACYGAPFFAYALLRAADGSRRHVALAGLALAAAALTEWQTAVSALLAGGVLLCVAILSALRGRRSWDAPARMALGGLLGGLLVLPLAVATARAVAAAGPAVRVGEVMAPSANLLAFVLPQELHPLWGEAIHVWRRANLWDPVTAGLMPLGLSLLALAALGVAASRRAALPWLALVLLGAGLALGPELHIGQAAYPDIPTPFALFRHLPYLTVSRNPSRYVLLATLGTAVLAAFGVRWLSGLPLARRRPALVPALVGLLVLFELWPVPYRLSVPPDTVVAERVGREVAALDPDGAVLTVPYKGDEPYILFHQIHHGRPIFSSAGALVRLPEPPLRANTPGFADLVTGRPYRDIFTPAPAPLAALNALHVRYVLFYPAEVPERQRERYRRTLRAVLQQAAPAHTSADGLLEAWRVPAVAAPPFLRVGPGWHAVEDWVDRGASRWMGQEATLVLERPRPTAAAITFTAVAYARPRRLEILADGQRAGLVDIGLGPTTATVRLPDGQGAAHLTLRSLDGADTPLDLDGTLDDRRLSIRLAGVQLSTEP